MPVVIGLKQNEIERVKYVDVSSEEVTKRR